MNLISHKNPEFSADKSGFQPKGVESDRSPGIFSSLTKKLKKEAPRSARVRLLGPFFSLRQSVTDAPRGS